MIDGESVLPEPALVRFAVDAYPRGMLQSNAAAVIQARGLTAEDLVWLLAEYEAAKPRVHTLRIDDTIETTESLG